MGEWHSSSQPSSSGSVLQVIKTESREGLMAAHTVFFSSFLPPSLSLPPPSLPLSFFPPPSLLPPSLSLPPPSSSLLQVWQHFDDGSCPGQSIGVRTRLENGLSGFILTKNISDKPVNAPEERVHVSPTTLSSSLCTKTRPPDVRLGEANGSTGNIIIPDC